MKTWTQKKPLRRYAHLKYDGHNLTVKKWGHGVNDVLYFSSNMRALDLSWMNRRFERVPAGMTLCCELYGEGRPASWVSTAIACALDEAKVGVFAVPTLQLITLEDLADHVTGQWGLEFIPFYTHIQDYKAHPLCLGEFIGINQLEAELQSKLVDRAEGFVFKHHQHDDDPLKYKLEHTCDLIVWGIEPGEGKFAGQCGALVCGLIDGTAVANVSGFTDSVRAAISDKDIGRVVEVKYQYVGAGGKLRHPRFVRWRDDKDADKCDGTDIL